MGLTPIDQLIASKLRLAGFKLAPKSDTVDMSVEGVRSRRLTRTSCNATKRKLLWIQNQASK